MGNKKLLYRVISSTRHVNEAMKAIEKEKKISRDDHLIKEFIRNYFDKTV